jgi:hypothetical protein
MKESISNTESNKDVKAERKLVDKGLGYYICTTVADRRLCPKSKDFATLKIAEEALTILNQGQNTPTPIYKILKSNQS